MRYLRFIFSVCALSLVMATNAFGNSLAEQEHERRCKGYANSSSNFYEICKVAYDVTSGTWNYGGYARRVKECNPAANSLTTQDCARILGLTKAVNSNATNKAKRSPLRTMVVVTAARGGQIANWDKNSKQGLFTKHLLKALTGAADSTSISGNWDGTITLGEVKTYLDRSMTCDARRRFKRNQNATISGNMGAVLKPKAPKSRNLDSIAVIIGNSDYKGNIPDVEFAGNDADAMKRLVLKTLGYQSKNIIDVRDATKAELSELFGTNSSHKGILFNLVKPLNTNVLVFYSGHGVPGMSDKRGYLLSVDADPNRSELTGYPVDTLLKNLSKIPAKSINVFIDASFSGDSPKGVLIAPRSGIAFETVVPKNTSSSELVPKNICIENTDREVCLFATTERSRIHENKIYWSVSNAMKKYVEEAQIRGLSLKKCDDILVSTTKVAAKPKIKPSKALVKQIQLALKSLSLYRGSVDGVAGVQSKSALKQWQKSAGLNQTGEIKEDQIARLESDALNGLGKREQERKAKAKRVVEANRIKNPDAIAVIIGNRDYEGRTPDVDFAGNDADAMRKFVLNKLGYRSGNIIDLRDASKARIEAVFGTKETHKGKLFDYVRAGDSDVIVFYSGHGVPGMSNKRGYLLSVDADPNRAELTGYPVDVLLKNLAKVPAKSMMVFIDACFSGDSQKGMLVLSTSGLTVTIKTPKKASDNMVVITAAEGNQFASWDEEAKHGLFTKHLLEALNGAADKQSATGNKDGKVTLGEVKAYLDREMTYQARRRFSRDQHATVSGDLNTVLSAY